MDYFQPYSPSLDGAIVAAWDTNIAEAEVAPWFRDVIAAQRASLLPRFATCYAHVRSLPRGTRRALQRQLSRSTEPSIPSDWRSRLAGSLAGAALLLALAQGAHAATITVTTQHPAIDAGDGQCSLIEAIVNANDDAATHPDCAAGNGADTIVLPKKITQTLTSNFPYSLNGLPVITSQITIMGGGGKIVREAAAPEFRLIAVSASGDLTLDHVTLSGGSYSGSGAGVSNGGYLTIKNSTISGNSAGGGCGGIRNVGSGIIENSRVFGNTAGIYGAGGVCNFGTLSIKNSIISNNSALSSGGGVVNAVDAVLTIEKSTISGNTTGQAGGGVYNYSGRLMIDNGTISGNTAVERGAGICNINGTFTSAVATATIDNSTVSGNTATLSGGGIYNAGYLYINRSLISGNQAPAGPEADNNNVTGHIYVSNFNLFGVSNNAGVAGFTPSGSDIVPTVALNMIIGPLKKNGGPTETHALVKNSPAINVVPTADPGCAGTDQRGKTRPHGPGCDVGAFEK